MSGAKSSQRSVKVQLKNIWHKLWSLGKKIYIDIALIPISFPRTPTPLHRHSRHTHRHTHRHTSHPPTSSFIGGLTPDGCQQYDVSSFLGSHLLKTIACCVKMTKFAKIE
ncbi:MAG: hypothetical protein F6J93_12375 [Oscillatoria sp. SIO1A7]|nr:hypothetical protein [Oscillatoria sp. SIO1A7]